VTITYRFNHHNTCPICGKDNCSKTDTGLYFCIRERADTSDFKFIKVCSNSDFALFVSREDHERRQQEWQYERNYRPYKPAYRPGHADPKVKIKRPPEGASEELAESTAVYSKKQDRVAEVAASLGVSAESLKSLRAGWCEKFVTGSKTGSTVVYPPHLVTPELDENGEVTAISMRWDVDGRAVKECRRGGTRGLVYSADSFAESASGAIFCPEGASDTAALLTMGLRAAGRPGKDSGKELLAMLVGPEVVNGTPVVIVADNDASGVGRKGAERTAQAVANRTGDLILVASVPDGKKDTRDWLKDACQRNNVDPNNKDSCWRLGKEFADALFRSAAEFWPLPAVRGETESEPESEPFCSTYRLKATSEKYDREDDEKDRPEGRFG
jgi:hypothetical protein